MHLQRFWHRLRSQSYRRAAPAWPENSTRIQVQHGYLLLLFSFCLLLLHLLLQQQPSIYFSWYFLLLVSPSPAAFSYLLLLSPPPAGTSYILLLVFLLLLPSPICFSSSSSSCNNLLYPAPGISFSWYFLLLSASPAFSSSCYNREGCYLPLLLPPPPSLFVAVVDLCCLLLLPRLLLHVNLSLSRLSCLWLITLPCHASFFVGF